MGARGREYVVREADRSIALARYRTLIDESRRGVKILQVTPYFAPAWAYGGPPRVMARLRGRPRRARASTSMSSRPTFSTSTRGARPRHRDARRGPRAPLPERRRTRSPGARRNTFREGCSLRFWRRRPLRRRSTSRTRAPTSPRRPTSRSSSSRRPLVRLCVRFAAPLVGPPWRGQGRLRPRPRPPDAATLNAAARTDVARGGALRGARGPRRGDPIRPAPAAAGAGRDARCLPCAAGGRRRHAPAPLPRPDQPAARASTG